MQGISEDCTIQEYDSSPPLHIFHHIAKTAGTSVKAALSKWFILVSDYLITSRQKVEEYHRNPINLNSLTPMHCLCGHYGGGLLAKRYPEVFQNRERFRVFAFIRDPLKTKISLYYYRLKRERRKHASLKEHLLDRENYLNFIASYFGCTEDDFEDILNQYFFIGITEEIQFSMDRLAELICKPRVRVPLKNPSKRNDEIVNLPTSVIDQFREDNSLDYKIYDYCVNRLHATNVSEQI